MGGQAHFLFAPQQQRRLSGYRTAGGVGGVALSMVSLLDMGVAKHHRGTGFKAVLGYTILRGQGSWVDPPVPRGRPVSPT